jgi:hypothetical protein
MFLFQICNFAFPKYVSDITSWISFSHFYFRKLSSFSYLSTHYQAFLPTNKVALTKMETSEEENQTTLGERPTGSGEKKARRAVDWRGMDDNAKDQEHWRMNLDTNLWEDGQGCDIDRIKISSGGCARIVPTTTTAAPAGVAVAGCFGGQLTVESGEQRAAEAPAHGRRRRLQRTAGDGSGLLPRSSNA